jgi:sulfide:quinone oxidoreductase
MEGTRPKAQARTVVVLGAGFGGIAAALDLRAGLEPSHRVVLVDRRSTFMMGLRKQWLLTGAAKRADGERSIDALRGKGVDVRRASVTAIDTRSQSVQTDGASILYDYLVVALGAEPRPDLVSGFSPAVFDMYDVEDVERARAPLGSITKGRIVVGVFGLPFKCPPAPAASAS